MSRPIDQEFAVVVAALLAGRIDGQQAIASLAAIHTAHLAAILADPETVEAVAQVMDPDVCIAFGPDCATPSCREGWRQARAVIAVIAERQGVDHA